MRGHAHSSAARGAVYQNITFVNGTSRTRIPGEWTNKGEKRIVYGPDCELVTYWNHRKYDAPDAKRNPRSTA